MTCQNPAMSECEQYKGMHIQFYDHDDKQNGASWKENLISSPNKCWQTCFFGGRRSEELWKWIWKEMSINVFALK